MIFANRPLNEGRVDPNWWISDDGRYSIRRYRYWRADGRSCGPADACDPYFAAYRRADGKSLGGRNVKLPSFEVAAGLCMDDERGEE